MIKETRLNGSFGFDAGSVVVGTLRQILKDEGFRGLYRGLSPTIFALVPNWAVSLLFIMLLSTSEML
jgi:hypothetical protein